MKTKRQYFPDSEISLERDGWKLKITITEYRGDFDTGTEHKIIAHVSCCSIRWMASQLWGILRSYRKELEQSETAMRTGDF